MVQGRENDSTKLNVYPLIPGFSVYSLNAEVHYPYLLGFSERNELKFKAFPAFETVSVQKILTPAKTILSPRNSHRGTSFV
jgi:hypothetical protein